MSKSKKRSDSVQQSACDSDYAQLSIFEAFVDILDNMEGSVSPEQLFEASQMLERAGERMLKRAEAERKRKAEEDRLAVERLRQAAHEAHIAKITSMELPMDWDNAFLTDSRAEGVHADSTADGLILSLTNLGRVDIEYISAVCGLELKEVIQSLRGSIYQNPERWEECFYKGWETADEYLSGNMLRKLKAAKSANIKYNGWFSENVEAIKKVLPATVDAGDIYITLGSPWVPADIIDEFIEHLLGEFILDWRNESSSYLRVAHDPITGTWEIPKKSRYRYTSNEVKSYSVYGTARMGALHIMEHTLNMSPIIVCDETKDKKTKKKIRTLNEKETVLALEKQRRMIEEFRNWVWTDDLRRERLESIYAEKYGSVCRRRFDGSFLAFPGLAEDIVLYPYQKDAAARILFSPNTLLAHEVGAGKTYIMIAAGMELRRMGISKKNLYVVPNNILGQWKSLFEKLYPAADVLCVEPRDFMPDKREAMLERIRDEEHDAVIISYSSFAMIPLSREYQRRELTGQLEAIGKIINDPRKETGRLHRKSEAVTEALRKLDEALHEAGDKVFFDDLGINTLFVDEAHNFKNVGFSTRLSSVPGINTTGSARCRDMMDKVHCVQKNNDGRGVVFATGTPVSNSIADVFVMQQYLQSGDLELVDLQSFDSWAGMFAEQSTEFEIDVDTSNYRMRTRFSRFHNLPELTAMLSTVADFHEPELPEGLPRFDGHDDVLVGRTDRLERYLRQISDRADVVRSGLISRKDDNMLLITTDGRKAALDIRLVQPDAPFVYQSKLARCAEQVIGVYRKTADRRCAQLIFCDISTPREGFNIYDDMRDLLTELGVKREEIAFIHDHDTPAQREKLFAKVRKGDIRVLLGSTFKLGMGVNIQERLAALHHLDVPWRPSDMVQREGRILRSGNTCESISIFRYITEGSFDAYSWQILEGKQRFIDQLLSGTLSQRSGSDIDDSTLSYAEVKALAIGNPLLKLRVETANELDRLLTLHYRLTEERQDLEAELTALPGKIATQRETVKRCEADITRREQYSRPTDEKQRQSIRQQLYNGVVGNTLKDKERPLMDYRGFEIILPANMLESRPFVWLRGAGKYYVEMGFSDVGMLVRIDNYIDELEQQLEHLQEGLDKFEGRERDIRTLLAEKTGCTEQIAKCRDQLAEIDARLGI